MLDLPSTFAPSVSGTADLARPSAPSGFAAAVSATETGSAFSGSVGIVGSISFQPDVHSQLYGFEVDALRNAEFMRKLQTFLERIRCEERLF